MTTTVVQRHKVTLAFRVRHGFGRLLLYAVICIGAFVFMLPFLWMLSTSVTPKEWVGVVPMRWIPPCEDSLNCGHFFRLS